MMNPVHRLVRQSKTMFALWREDYLDPADRALLDPTSPHRALRPARLAQYRDERERWVLKRAFGRMGDSVVIGALVSDADWGAALSKRRASRASSASRSAFVSGRSRSMPAALPCARRLPRQRALRRLLQPRLADPFTTHEAFHVATLVQTA
jgi:hypothetical protein